MTSRHLVQGGDVGHWDQAIYAFLAEKERRSGSIRTVRAYSGMLYRFFGTLGKPPDEVTATEIFGNAHGIGLSGNKPFSITIGARIACLSSFYRFLIRMALVSANPCDQLERPKATPALPRGLTATDFGITIGTDGINLDCNGHTINGTIVDNSSGVRLTGKTGVTTKNCHANNFFDRFTVVAIGATPLNFGRLFDSGRTLAPERQPPVNAGHGEAAKELFKLFSKTIPQRFPAVTRQQSAVLPVESLLPTLGEDVFPVKEVVLWK